MCLLIRFKVLYPYFSFSELFDYLCWPIYSTKYTNKFFFLCLQSRTNYLTKAEKPSKIEQEKKRLISAFACFLTAIARV